MTDTEIIELIETFNGHSFSTLDFANKIESYFPEKWKSIVEQYGIGGKGAGRSFSSFSRVSQYLKKQVNDQYLEALDYRSAPETWGSPVIRYWCSNKNSMGAQDYPDEISSPETVTEGAKTAVIVNRYERNKSARLECIKEWGVNCFVCGFDFEKMYGSVGAGFIHVHHLKPLFEIGKKYQLNPKEDLRPLCPNCHSIVIERIQ